MTKSKFQKSLDERHEKIAKIEETISELKNKLKELNAEKRTHTRFIETAEEMLED